MILFSSDYHISEIYEAALKSGFKIDLLVSENAKPSGRGRVIKPNGACLFAKDKDVRTLTPDYLDKKAIDTIKEISNKSEDRIAFVFSYGKIIPQDIIDIFEGRVYNLHPSLLPSYRGPTPLQSALLDGAKSIGYSVIKLTERLDAGDIVFSEEIAVADSDNYNSLMDKVIHNFCNNFKKISNAFGDTGEEFKKQDEGKATYTSKFSKEDGEIKNSDTAQTALYKIRAFSSWPKAFLLTSAGERLIVHKAHIESDRLVIDVIQKQSGKPMAFDKFKLGNQTLLTGLPDFVRI